MKGFKLAASNIGWQESDNDLICGLMSELGYAGIEIAPTRVEPNEPYENAAKAKQYLKDIESDYGLKVCSMQSIWRGEAGNIFNPDDQPRLLALTNRLLSYASEIRCPNVVFGCPRNRKRPKSRKPEDALPFFMECEEAARRYGVVFSIEANPSIYDTNFLNTTAEACSYLQKLPASEFLAINLDLGTIIANEEPIESIIPFMPFINHVHISEPYLAGIHHRPEHSLLREILEENRYQGYISLEMARCDASTMMDCLEYVAEVFR